MQGSPIRRRRMPGLTRTFLKGLAVVLPALLTAYMVFWVANAAEQTLGAAIRRMAPEGTYVRGLGIVLGLVTIFVIGVLMNLWLAQKLLGAFEGAVARIPLVKTIYGSIKDLMGFLSGEGKKELEQVVLVRFEQPPMRLLGFVTREDLTATSPELDADQIAVYLPMSYQIGGYTVIVSRDRVSPVAMTVEEGMRFAMTAGISAKRAGTAFPATSPAAPSGRTAPRTGSRR